MKWTAIPALLMCTPALASNACVSEVITSHAQVAVSDGSEYAVETYYRSADEAVVSFQGPQASDIIAEGPYAWYRQGEKAGLAGDAEKRFALGHQYHAMILYFADIITDIVEDEAIELLGETRHGRTGQYPNGGTVSLVDGEQSGQPAGLVMRLPDETPIHVTLHDWRETDAGQALPDRIEIHHGESVFTYEYTSVEITQGDVLDFHQRYASPGTDAIDIYRLHRALLAAHCRGDAGLIASLSAPETLVAGGGELHTPSDEDTRAQFTDLFEQLNYTAYHDLKPPVIEVAAGGDLGWAGVEVRAVAEVKESGAKIDDQWAWIMLVKKIDGTWRHAGNASNRRAPS